MTPERRERGPRESARNSHYDMCDSPDCPCYLEALVDVTRWIANGHKWESEQTP